jgi:hypothetical protein
MAVAVAIACAAILAVGAAFHLYWAFGGRAGRTVALPQFESGQPIVAWSSPGSFAVGAMLTLIAALALAGGGVFSTPLPPGWLRAILAILAAVFAARGLSWHRYFGLLKTVRATEFARFDTRIYSPLCLLLALGFSALFVRLAVG